MQIVPIIIKLDLDWQIEVSGLQFDMESGTRKEMQESSANRYI